MFLGLGVLRFSRFRVTSYTSTVSRVTTTFTIRGTHIGFYRVAM